MPVATLVPLLATLLGAAAALPAQAPTAAIAPAASSPFPRRITLARRFGLAEGLDRVPAYQVIRAPDGVLWIATGSGPATWDGMRFARVPFPAPWTGLEVRRLLFLGSDTWAATPRGLFRRRGTGPWEHLAGRPGFVPEGRTWQLVPWTPPGAPPALVVAVEDSLHLVDPATGRARGVLAPAGFPTAGAMLAVTDVGDGAALWVATLRGGLWRWRAGDRAPRWIVRREPSERAAVEDVRPCPPLGPGAVALAADDGAWAIGADLVPRRIGTLRRVRRVACTGSAARPVFWLGNDVGAVERVGDDGAVPVTLAPRTVPVAVQALDVVEVRGDEPAVFVAQAHGAMWRGAATPLAMLDLPGDADDFSYVAIAEQPRRAARARLLASAAPVGTRDLLARDGDDAPTPRRFANFLRFRDSTLVGIASDGLLRLDGRRWTPLRAVEGRRVRTATRAAYPGREEIVASLPSGLLRVSLAGDSLGPFAPALGGNVERLAWDSVRAELFAARHDTVFRVRDQGARVDTLTRGDGLPGGPYRFLRHARLADGTALLAVSSAYGLAVADPDAVRPAFVRWDTASVAGLHDVDVTASAVFPDGRLVVGTAGGVAVLRLGRPVTAPPRLLAWYDAEDGLDDPLVFNTMRTPGSRTLFLATARGIAELAVPTAAPGPIGRAPLVVRVAGGPERRALGDTAVLGWDDRVLHVEARLVNDRHEVDTRYAIALREAGARDAPAEWTHDGTRTFEALSDGRYELVVRARDWLGRETPPHILQVVVRPPWWRTPWSIAGALALLLAGGTVAARARTRRLRARASEAEAAAARLRASEERFRRLFDRGADPQLVVEAGTVADANPAALALFGHPRTALVGADVGALLGAPAGEGEDGVAHAADGTAIPVAIRRTAIPLDGGTVEHVELRDLREPQRLARERAELAEQLLAARRLESLGTLAGGVAHDFNNLLGVIRMNAELADVALDDADAAAVRASLASVVDASDRGRDIVRQILTFGRRTPPVRRPLRLAEVVRATQPLLRASLPATVALEVRDDAGDDGWIAADPTQLRQLLLNLAANAAHAMRDRPAGTFRLAVAACEIGPASPAAVRTLPSGPGVCLVAEDTGCGMPPETVARIFEPFFTTKAPGEGTGLGLAVLHGIVGAHGGAVHVSSAVGAGTRVEIVFPRVDAAAPAPAPSAIPPALRGEPTGDVVLLVDDEAGLRDAGARALGAAGFAVRVAASGEEALAALEASEGEVACVVSDQTMPGMPGDALAATIATRWPGIPVVLVSGNAGRIPDEATTRGHVVQVLEKPYTRAALVSAVTRALAAARRGVAAR